MGNTEDRHKRFQADMEAAGYLVVEVLLPGHEEITPSVPCLPKEQPKTEIDLYDNVAVLVEYAKHLFEVIDDAATTREEHSIATTADLGVRICVELNERMKALYEWCKSKAGDSSTPQGS